MVQKAIAEIKKRMRAEGDAERARGAEKYLKSPLRFHGLKAKFLHDAVKEFGKAFPQPDKNELLSLADELWASEWFEEKAFGIELLRCYWELLRPADLPLVERWIGDCDTWATLDTLAYHILSRLVARYPQLYPRVRRWTKSPHMWKRRAAVLCHALPLGWRDRPKRLPKSIDPDTKFARPDLFYSTCEELIAEKEFFIRKAIGWALREVSKTRPDEVHAFLLGTKDRASGLTKREGAKRLPERMRREILGD